MLSSIAWTTSRFLAHRTGSLGRAIFKAADIYVKSFKNLNYDMRTNGELRLLDRLVDVAPRTIFDVGANQGEYMRACARRFPKSDIFAFEIAPATFEKLKAAAEAIPHANLYGYGLSNVNGTVQILYNAHHDGVSSLIEQVEAIHDAAWVKQDARVTTGDDFCQAHGITTIDLMKIDVEGAEHLVLEGFRSMLDRGAVKSVQFEFGMVNIYSKFLLVDYWNLFRRRDFILGPVFPNGVDFRDYSPRHEDFQGPPNYFAVHRSRTDIADAVRLS